MPEEDPLPPSPPLATNGKPHATTVSDLVAVQNFLAELIRDTEARLTKSLNDYVIAHDKEHQRHLAATKPYQIFIDQERQKNEDWDARLRPPMRLAHFVWRNWKTLVPIAIAILIALGVIHGTLDLGIKQ